jgi:uncharacterized RDD family membrane protein YckC
VTAGFLIRAGAYLIDLAIMSLALALVVVPLMWGASSLGQSSPILGGLVGLLAIVLAMVGSAGYLIWFWANRGATPGKRLLKLRVIRQDGNEPLGYTKAAIRALGYIVSSILGVGFLMIAFNDRRLGLHDMMAGTRVTRQV